MKKAKTTTVAKPAKPAKLAAPVAQRLQHQITSLQHQVTSLKHRQGGTSKHKAKATTKHSRARGWSPDEDVALCSARAVAEHLRLTAGVAVADADVLALHRAAGGDDNAGASLRDALRAAEVYGLAGRRVVIAYPVLADSQPVILGGVMPGGEPHAVVFDRGACWSWGEPFDPAGFTVEEVWSVRWAA